MLEASAAHGRRTSRYVLALAVVALALVGGLLVVAHRGSDRVAAPKQSFNTTGTVSVVAQCGTDYCLMGAADSNGVGWQWSVKTGVPIPVEWQGATVSGTVTIGSDWGDDSTFTSDGKSMPVFGGKQDPSIGHSFTAVG